MPVKPSITWQDRVQRVAQYHADCCKENPKWRLSDTAKELERSVGRISEDLLLAEWLHDDKVKGCYSATEALDLVKRMKRDIQLKKYERT